ncbi:MAG: hypothetical protein WDN25_14190 [Acetobacteraceae bacterium]
MPLAGTDWYPGKLGAACDRSRRSRPRARHPLFLISFVDLLGHLRAKLVPAAAIGAMQANGAGFAGFAVHFDMAPSDPDMLAMPRS